jgi:hypothetical protein
VQKQFGLRMNDLVKLLKKFLPNFASDGLVKSRFTPPIVVPAFIITSVILAAISNQKSALKIETVQIHQVEQRKATTEKEKCEAEIVSLGYGVTAKASKPENQEAQDKDFANLCQVIRTAIANVESARSAGSQAYAAWVSLVFVVVATFAAAAAAWFTQKQLGILTDEHRPWLIIKSMKAQAATSIGKKASVVVRVAIRNVSSVSAYDVSLKFAAFAYYGSDHTRRDDIERARANGEGELITWRLLIPPHETGKTEYVINFDPPEEGTALFGHVYVLVTAIYPIRGSKMQGSAGRVFHGQIHQAETGEFCIPKFHRVDYLPHW